MKSGDEAMSYFYKILMNFLYGKFGINHESIVTEIYNQKKYEELMKKDNFQTAEKLTGHYYIANYITNKNSMTDDTEWNAPRMSGKSGSTFPIFPHFPKFKTAPSNDINNINNQSHPFSLTTT
ncbi:hypothetical protein RND71_039725 [Anisodus tanguticus]|uniref:DNA-directed DNA polymerase n=1 Tax=Anisodus tanguticus TaxID=243964 RepID=A0AAE1QXZ2_9SOLA|nr:hypothetical protein RND71_039725 [Anisodus tanguticus]